MTSHRIGLPTTLGLAVTALVIGALGVYVGQADDAPGAGGLGLLLMLTGVVLAVRAGRNRLPRWAARTALALGVAIAAFAGLIAHGVSVASPLFSDPQEVPSAAAPVPSAQYALAIERAQPLVRAAIMEQNLPGVSLAVGTGGATVWAEGFGWRDIATRAPVTPDTRFNIGTAASSVAAFAVPLGMTHTRADAAADWSPEHIVEPEEDFPLLTILRHVIFRPLGLAPSQPLPGDRATFYVPRSGNEPRRGRQLMRMRDLACCTDGRAFSSTPSDLVRFALATRPASVNGDLAGGMVMSLLTERDSGLVVAVTANVAHAKTAALARRIRDAFAEPHR